MSADYTYDEALTGYVTRMILALLILGAAGYAAVKYLPGRFSASGKGHLKVMGSLPLGRDMVYIVKTGPHVVAFFSGKTGQSVLGRWSLEEWDDYEAAASFAERAVSRDRGDAATGYEHDDEKR